MKKKNTLGKNALDLSEFRYVIIVVLIIAMLAMLPFLSNSKLTGLAGGGGKLRIKTQCVDTIDNDGDGLIDFGEDPGCNSRNDDSEIDCIAERCDNKDNDCDGLIDEGFNVRCGVNSDCGTPGWKGDDYCGKDGNVHGTWVKSYCVNSATCSSYCSNVDSDVVVSICGNGCLEGKCVVE